MTRYTQYSHPSTPSTPPRGLPNCRCKYVPVLPARPKLEGGALLGSLALLLLLVVYAWPLIVIGAVYDARILAYEAGEW